MNVTIKNHDFPLEVVVNLMDDDLREQLHGQFDSDQDFVDAYCELHFSVFGVEFEVN